MCHRARSFGVGLNLGAPVKSFRSWRILPVILALGATCAFAPSVPAALSAQQQTSQPPHELKVTEYHLPPGELAKARALYEIRTELYLLGMVFGIVVLWVLLKLCVGPAFRDLAERVSHNSFVQALVFVPLFALLIAIISLPMDVYEHHVSREYGLSVQGWSSWTADWLKGEGVALVIAVFVVFALSWIIRRSPRRWWFYFWLVTLPFVVLLVFVAPVILDPMFNKFEPLEKTQLQLVAAIEKETQCGGLNIPPDRMFEMKASEKVTTYNAYVTGIGATKRVVVWDNTSRDMTTPETLFVFGHEMGHYVLNHVYKGLLFFSAMSLLGFWLGRKIVVAMLARRGRAWHIRGINDLAALPALMLTLSLLSLIGEPVGNLFSRYLEHQADIYGLEVTHGLFPNNAEVAASSFQKLGEKSYDYPTPNPLLVFWSYSHPTIAERIQFALHYHPWDSAEGPKYVK